MEICHSTISDKYSDYTGFGAGDVSVLVSVMKPKFNVIVNKEDAEDDVDAVMIATTNIDSAKETMMTGLNRSVVQKRTIQKNASPARNMATVLNRRRRKTNEIKL